MIYIVTFERKWAGVRAMTSGNRPWQRDTMRANGNSDARTAVAKVEHNCLGETVCDPTTGKAYSCINWRLVSVYPLK